MIEMARQTRHKLESRPYLARTLFASFRERQRQDDVAGVRTRAATSLVAMLSATSGWPLSTDRDNVVGPMILRLTPVPCLPSLPLPPPYMYTFLPPRFTRPIPFSPRARDDTTVIAAPVSIRETRCA